jgi:glucose/arabinose dehydrogenase
MRVALPLSCVLLLAGCGGAPDPITVPDGVRVTTVAKRVPRPTNIAFGARGAMWTTSAGYAPAASDGVWRTARAGASPRQVVRGLDTALGLAWYRGELYVSHRVRSGGPFVGRVTAFSGFDGRRLRRRRTVLARLPVGQHNVDSIVPGPDGRLYVGVGSVANARRGRSRHSGSVLSFLPSGRGLRVEARGFRNPYGLAFVPGTRRLLVSDNGRDDLGLFRPPDELNLVDTARRASAHYGFPGCFGQGGRACLHTVPALARLAPHAAAAGVALTSRFGRYGLSAFVAENGSSFSANRTGSDIVRVSLRRRGRGYRAVVHRFARGLGRHDPLGAAIGPSGALYVTLYRSARIVRFSARPPVHRGSTKG